MVNHRGLQSNFKFNTILIFVSAPFSILSDLRVPCDAFKLFAKFLLDLVSSVALRSSFIINERF